MITVADVKQILVLYSYAEKELLLAVPSPMTISNKVLNFSEAMLLFNLFMTLTPGLKNPTLPVLTFWSKRPCLN